jgi:PKD repeat protein
MPGSQGRSIRKDSLMAHRISSVPCRQLFRGKVGFALCLLGSGVASPQWLRADEVCDDFPDVHTHWNFRVPRCGATLNFEERDGFARIHTPDGVTASGDFDSWLGVDFAPTLERTDMGTGDWIVSTRVEFETPPTGANYHAGLVFFFGPRANNDAVYWGEYSANGIVAIERAGNNIRPTYVADIGPVSLQVEKLGNTFHFRHRNDDGTDWIEDVAYENDSEIDPTLFSEEPVTSVGVIVKTWGGAGSPDVIADFDYVCLEVPGALPGAVVADPIPLISPVTNLECARKPDGSLDLKWVTCEGGSTPVTVTIAGQDVATVPPGQNSTTIPPPIPGGSIVNVQVDNGFQRPARCTIADAIRDVCDEFDEDTIASGEWVLRTPSVPLDPPTASFEENPGALRFHVAVGALDNWTGVDNAPTIERYDMGELDWTISTRMSFPEEIGSPVGPHHVGLMFGYGLGQPDDAFNDITYWGEYSDAANLRVERTGAAITPMIPYAGAPVSLQMQKAGDSVTFSHRQEDSDPWTIDAQYTIQLPYPANGAGSPPAGTPVSRVGLIIKTWGGGPEVTADFDYFCLQVLDSPPIPKITADPISGTVPVEVMFSSTGSVDPSGGTLTYSWDFGDSSPAGTGESVKHTYTKGGLITPTLTATDDEKNPGSSSTLLYLSDDPAPFTLTQLGTQGQPGLVTVDKSGATPVYCLDVGGNAIATTIDNAYFVNQKVTGDFKVRAKMLNGSFPVVRARAGLMARLALDSKSSNASMLIDSQDDGFAFQIRRVDGQTTMKSGGPVDPPRGAFPVWLQLERQGMTFIGSYSTDGVSFTEYSRGDADSLNVADLFVGFAATSGDNRFRAEYCAELDFGTGPPPGPVFHRGDADSNGEVQLTDAIRILGILFLGQGTISCMDAADADDNGTLQLTDAIRILGVLFLGQGVIPPPGPTSEPCGLDPTADDGIGCDSYPPCQ